jgi:glycopeptide antibiotics resistance protein
MRITIKSFWPAIVWLILSSIAFCLPGKALPQNDWFAIIQLDKWIHVGLFSVMIFLWCLPLLHKPSIHLPISKLLIWITIAFFCYGIAMEFIQHFFVSNRSFDIGDIAADAIGCLIGFLFVKRQHRLFVK